MGPGATVSVLGTGVPRLACLRPAAWLKGGPSTARLHQHKPKTLARGQASRGGRRKTSSGAASPGWLARGGEIKARDTSRGLCDASHDDWRGKRSVLLSSLAKREQAQARASSKGIHFGATRPRPVQWQDGGHRGDQDSVIASAFGSRRPNLVGITCTRCSPSKWPLLAPFPLNIWEEAQGLCL